jgi:hypothetical protein
VREHTPGPWRVEADPQNCFIYGAEDPDPTSEEDGYIAELASNSNDAERVRVNAEFVVRACNSYAALRDLISRAVNGVGGNFRLDVPGSPLGWECRDYEQGLCVFCEASVPDHEPTCPWPEMVEIVKAEARR